MSNTPSFPERLAADLAELSASSLHRTRRIVASACGPVVEVDGKQVVAFASNDYLGLANEPALVSAATTAATRWGVGSGASHLVSGHSGAHDLLERRLAAFVGAEAALSFSTGYMANLAVIPALLGRDGAVFSDRLNHASLIDSTLLSRAKYHRYTHVDMAQLARMLEESPARRKLIVSDAVFSMDGDIAPVTELLTLAERHDAYLLIDDAHGFGVLGPQGRGTLAEAGLTSPRLILMATLGKAAGVAGAFVAATTTVIDWLIQKSRPYIFTTAAPPMLAETLCVALALIEQGDWRRTHLQALVARLATGAQGLKWQLLPSRTAIQALLVGDNDAALALSRALWHEGYWVPAIRPPTVPLGTARLRISISATHTEAQVDGLIAALRRNEALA